MANNNDESFDHIDQRTNELGNAAFGPRQRAPSKYDRPPVSLNNDVNRVTRTVFNADGTAATSQSGVSRGYVDHGVKDDSSPFVTIRDSNNLHSIHPSEASLDSVVTLRSGGTMKLRHAIDGGFVKQRQDGSYYGVTGNGVPQKKPADEKLEEHPDLEMDAFPVEHRAADETFTELVAATLPGTQIAAVHSVAESGELNEEIASQLASQLGIEPEAFNEKMAPVWAAFKQQADAVIQGYGVDPQAVYAYAREHNNQALQQAMKDQGLKRTVSGYKSLAENYVMNLDTIAPEQILSASFGPGVSVRKDASGRIIVKTPTVETTWKAAVRAKLIKLG